MFYLGQPVRERLCRLRGPGRQLRPHDEHQIAPAKEGSDPVRRAADLHPSRQDQDDCAHEGQVQDPAQEAMVAVHVHVLPARTQADGAAHLRGPQGGPCREHLPAHPRRRY